MKRLSRVPARLTSTQRDYAKRTYAQLDTNGVALLQLPTGQGKTLVALKVIAEVLCHSLRPRPVVLVTPKMGRARQEQVLLEAFLGKRKSSVEDHEPWTRDASSVGGLARLHKGRAPRLGKVEWRSPQNLDKLPSGAIVVLDEIHRFPTFLKRQGNRAYELPIGRPCSPSKRKRFLLLSATPINPTRISEAEESGRADFDEEARCEDKKIRTGYLDLYRAMLGLSWLKTERKRELLRKLDAPEGAADLVTFAGVLLEVMKNLTPVPGPRKLATLGPKGKPAYQPAISPHKDECYAPSLKGLLGFHEGLPDEDDLHYYCAERMALAGATAKQSKQNETGSTGFLPLPKTFRGKGLFHHQPKALYVQETLRSLRVLEKNKMQIRRQLGGKVAALYDFLRHTWSERSGQKKWRVLIYCAHRGSVAALAAELKNRFAKDKIACSCETPSMPAYGKWGGRRVVWDTEGYSSGEDSPRRCEGEVITQFRRARDNLRCGAKPNTLHCPRGFVLVTSDRLSESIDLHDHCEVMIHFDLDWSPLRMMQRYGRLWRIDKVKNPDKPPKQPAVFHMVQPGSVDEEILWRLENRWARLRKLGLGLDTVALDYWLGKRIYGRADSK